MVWQVDGLAPKSDPVTDLAICLLLLYHGSLNRIIEEQPQNVKGNAVLVD
jgi:hypothetical protein